MLDNLDVNITEYMTPEIQAALLDILREYYIYIIPVVVLYTLYDMVKRSSKKKTTLLEEAECSRKEYILNDITASELILVDADLILATLVSTLKKDIYKLENLISTASDSERLEISHLIKELEDRLAPLTNDADKETT